MPKGSPPAKDASLAVVVPSAERDTPAWSKVGVIAAVGFVIGVAWPRVMGVSLARRAPAEASASASAHAAGGRAPEAPPASVIAKAPMPAASGPAPAATPSASAAAAAAAAPPTISVQKGSVMSCKTADGETKKGSKDCGPIPGIDLLVTPRVRKIATCGGVEGQTGKLTLVVNADFASGRFWYDVGKSSTVQNVEAVSSCLKTAFHGTSTTATTHEHPRYTVLYTATLTAPAPPAAVPEVDAHKSDKPADKSDRAAKESHDDAKDAKDDRPPADAPATGEAQVAWEVALVRDVPKTGNLLARLPRGTKVKLGATKDGWYQVKYGEGFTSEGWVYRGAVGR